ncbi:MAG: PaaI family thioesterase [Limnohabitans sp.]|nr:PaaI family thioesterase [Limnohabitans sp.]
MLRGEVARTPVLTLLGGEVEFVDAAAGSLRARYQGRDDFRNPAGTVQGGMLSAMLDDVTASLVDATLTAGQGVATLSLQVSFLRPANVGIIQAEATMLRRGRDVCHVMGTLRQDGKDVATAMAVCKVV